MIVNAIIEKEMVNKCHVKNNKWSEYGSDYLDFNLWGI